MLLAELANSSQFFHHKLMYREQYTMVSREVRPMRAFWTAAIVAGVLAFTAREVRADPALFQPWIDGVSSEEPQMQVQRFDRNTYVIRQSIRTKFEGPFLYLLFGRDRVLLFDSGAGGLKIRPTVEKVISGWLREQRRSSIPLVVAHTHTHGDHHRAIANLATDQIPSSSVFIPPRLARSSASAIGPMTSSSTISVEEYWTSFQHPATKPHIS
jgi:glyoxylase-like metal-dependent hydrolase (beta-lactamase superfamily II)